MVDRQVHYGMDDLREHPDLYLVLGLSAPAYPSARSQTLTVDFNGSEIIARVRTPVENAPSRLMATKESILSAILLLILLEKRGPEWSDVLMRKVRQFAREYAIREASHGRNWANYWGAPDSDPAMLSRKFFESLEADEKDWQEAMERTSNALEHLESLDLIVDPFFTPEAMVLFGLIPLQFSVRTSRGEDMFREVKVEAALWSYHRSRRGHDFRIRGAEFIRRSLLQMATSYIESERRERTKRGKPTLQPPDKLTLD